MTPTHAHSALMGMFGMLAIALMAFVPRQTSSDAQWPGIEKYIRRAFWGTNVGLAMMIVMSLFPVGVPQVWDVLQSGYWHARSLEFIGSERSHVIEWLRMPGDVVVFGAAPLVGSTRVGHGIAIGAAFSMLLALFGVALIVLLTAIGR